MRTGFQRKGSVNMQLIHEMGVHEKEHELCLDKVPVEYGENAVTGTCRNPPQYAAVRCCVRIISSSIERCKMTDMERFDRKLWSTSKPLLFSHAPLILWTSFH